MASAAFAASPPLSLRVLSARASACSSFSTVKMPLPIASPSSVSAMTPFARVLLDELDEGTVDFIPNYDGSQTEPVLLPERLPVMLLNGASGMAVGMATEIPQHNMRGVDQRWEDRRGG